VTAVTNVLNEKGRLLTLTDKQAAREYGDPPKPLLSLGTVESMDALLKKLGYAEAERHEIKPTGAEQLGALLTAISPLLLMIGVIGIYIELKTPGFGIPGIIGITAFLLYFLGGYVAGLSGLEWVVLFLLGMALVVVELFVYPGTIALGLVGATLMLAAVIMAMVDLYPAKTPALPGLPAMPELVEFDRPLGILGLTTIGSVIVILVLSRFLPKTSLYRAVVSQSASGVRTEAAQEEKKASLRGQVGVTTSPLRPGGKAQFGDQILDVISQGDMVPKGARVRVIGYSGTQAIVEVLSGG
jgi:membrane-bound serine protease (ClpP class)